MATRYFRKVIRVTAMDSPNVKRALEQIARGEEPDLKRVVPGILDYPRYLHHRATWNVVAQTVGLDAQFYAGAEVKMFPRDWIAHSVELWHRYRKEGRRQFARGVGCDPAEGGDDTAYAVCGDLGLMRMESKPTPKTTVIKQDVKRLCREFEVDPWHVLLDRGGGGTQIADQLAEEGYEVGTVLFSEAVVPEPKRGLTTFPERVETKIVRSTFKNLRAEMYYRLREWMDPDGEWGGMSLPPAELGPAYAELHRQLPKFPLNYDAEGVIFLPPKKPKPGTAESNVQTILDMLGCSPDETDALVLARRAMTRKRVRTTAGAIG